MNEPVRKTVASLDQARFDKLMADKTAAETKLSLATSALKVFCSRYSDAHGFRVVLTPAQVRRDMEARS